MKTLRIAYGNRTAYNDKTTSDKDVKSFSMATFINSDLVFTTNAEGNIDILKDRISKPESNLTKTEFCDRLIKNLTTED
jgi:hypothetical protein